MPGSLPTEQAVAACAGHFIAFDAELALACLQVLFKIIHEHLLTPGACLERSLPSSEFIPACYKCDRVTLPRGNFDTPVIEVVGGVEVDVLNLTPHPLKALIRTPILCSSTATVSNRVGAIQHAGLAANTHDSREGNA